MQERTASVIVDRTMDGSMGEITPCVVLPFVDPDIPEAECPLRVLASAGPRAHAAHRDGHIAMDFDVLRIDLTG